MTYEVHVTQLVAQPTAVVRDHVLLDQLPTFLGEAFADIAQALGHQGLHPSGPPFGRYRPTEDGGFDVEAGFPTTRPPQREGRVLPDQLPGGSVACTLHRGRYEDVAAAYEATEAWLTENGFTATAPAWEVYLDDPTVDQPRTEVFLPCQPTRR